MKYILSSEGQVKGIFDFYKHLKTETDEEVELSLDQELELCYLSEQGIQPISGNIYLQNGHIIAKKQPIEIQREQKLKELNQTVEQKINQKYSYGKELKFMRMVMENQSTQELTDYLTFRDNLISNSNVIQQQILESEDPKSIIINL